MIDEKSPFIGNMDSRSNSQYWTADDALRFEEIALKKSRRITFYYIYDNYTHKSNNDIFNRVFAEKPKSREGSGIEKAYDKLFANYKRRASKGSFLFAYQSYLTKSPLWMYWGINTGFGHYRAKGLFVDGDRSEYPITFWTIPLGVFLGLELSMGWIKVAVQGGPSVLGVIQNRGDRGSIDSETVLPGKEKRQMSPGMFSEGRLSFDLGRAMKSKMVRLFGGFKMTGMHLDLIARHQYYSSFHDDGLSISGLSFGMGISFDYM